MEFYFKFSLLLFLNIDTIMQATRYQNNKSRKILIQNISKTTGHPLGQKKYNCNGNPTLLYEIKYAVNAAKGNVDNKNNNTLKITFRIVGLNKFLFMLLILKMESKFCLTFIYNPTALSAL